MPCHIIGTYGNTIHSTCLGISSQHSCKFSKCTHLKRRLGLRKKLENDQEHGRTLRNTFSKFRTSSLRFARIKKVFALVLLNELLFLANDSSSQFVNLKSFGFRSSVPVDVFVFMMREKIVMLGNKNVRISTQQNISQLHICLHAQLKGFQASLYHQCLSVINRRFSIR